MCHQIVFEKRIEVEKFIKRELAVYVQINHCEQLLQVTVTETIRLYQHSLRRICRGKIALCKTMGSRHGYEEVFSSPEY